MNINSRTLDSKYLYPFKYIPKSKLFYITGKPLFPGTSTLDQIERIMTIIPTPSRQGKLNNDVD